MSDLRPSYVVLEDPSTGAGVPLHYSQEGDTAASRNAAAMLVAKDAGGLLRYLKTDSSGVLQVSTGASSLAYLRSAATAGGSTSVVTVITQALTAAKVYRGIDLSVSCTRDTIYEVIWNDNGTEKILDVLAVGPGNMAETYSKVNHSFTAGSGTQQVLVKAKNLNSTSDFKAALALGEVQ